MEARDYLDRLKLEYNLKSDAELCVIMDVTAAAMAKWIARNKIPDKIINKSHNVLTNIKKPIKNPNLYEIDLLNVRAGAGEGIYNYVIETIDTISLDKSFFRTPINTNKVKGIQVDGDSMEPTLRDGDYVLIDENTTFGVNGIYAIQFGGQILIKRLQFKMDGAVLIISDNNKYQSETFNPLENQLPFQVLGIKVLSIQK